VPAPDDGPTTAQLVAAHATSERLSQQGSVGCLGGVLAVIALGAGFQPQWAYAAGGIVALAVAIALVSRGSKARGAVIPPIEEGLARLVAAQPTARLALVLQAHAAPGGPAPWVGLVWPAGDGPVVLDVRWWPAHRRGLKPRSAGRVRLEVPPADLPLQDLAGEATLPRARGTDGTPIALVAQLAGEPRPRRAEGNLASAPGGGGWEALARALVSRGIRAAEESDRDPPAL